MKHTFVGLCKMASCVCKLLCLGAFFSLALPQSWLKTEERGADPGTCEQARNLAVDEVADHVHDSCVLLAVPPLSSRAQSVLYEAREVFRNDSGVLVAHLRGSDSDIHWTTGTPPKTVPLLAFYARRRKERSCLLLPPEGEFLAEPYTGPLSLETIVQFINEKCGTFRTPSGGLTDEGLMHQHIMQSLYHLPSRFFGKCSRLRTAPSNLDFFRDFALRSRPVVIENAVRDWPAFKKWSHSYLWERYGNRTVHVKLTPDGVFEGVENAKLWADYRDNWIPEAVRSQLPYPDLVVVRPATSEMNFGEFLDFIGSGNKSFSAYLEYSSIPHYMPSLQQDMFELSFVEGELELRHLNMWLSDGNTLGKLHFDPYDNLLCQASVPHTRLCTLNTHTHTHT